MTEDRAAELLKAGTKVQVLVPETKDEKRHFEGSWCHGPMDDLHLRFGTVERDYEPGYGTVLLSFKNLEHPNAPPETWWWDIRYVEEI